MASSSIAEGSSKATPRTTGSVGYDPEFAETTAPFRTALASIRKSLPHPDPKTALELRANTEVLIRTTFPHIEDDGILKETAHTVTSFDGVSITVTRWATEAHNAPLGPSEPPRRAVLHIHGGGFITGSVKDFSPMVKRDVLSWDTQVFAVGYRLAPENPAPGPVEDCYAALAWLSAHAAEFGVDPARIVIVGPSAGGGVAAGLALVARDRRLSPPVAKAVLVYPMLDDRTIGRYGEDWPVREFLMWTEPQNAIGWRAYLGEERAGRADAEVSVYDAPGRASVKDLVGLPSMYIDTGSLDLFRDEDIAYAARLVEANVQTEFHLYPGVPHAFESAGTPGVVKAALENRRRAICSV
ncbi:hypothetical protein N0V82_005879 [Gnomoniopsis sp. IMI 355080]|nr:hypothetical protein N0V82_005879 [Gnomoniopsis sp. IMI 355080]